MPFDLIISREESLELLNSDSARASRPISQAEFESLLRGAPRKRRPDGTYWVSRPDTGEPWLAMSLQSSGSVLLSVSCSSYSFIRNFVDAVDIAVRLAPTINAKVFDRANGLVVSGANIDRLLAPDSEFVQNQASAFGEVVKRVIGGAGQLEYPLGSIDIADQYFLFTLIPDKPIDFEKRLVPPLRDLISGKQLVTRRPQIVSIVDSKVAGDIANVQMRSTGEIDIWRGFCPLPFSRTASVVQDIAEFLTEELYTVQLFCGRPLSPNLDDDIRQRVNGLGVEFYEWISSRGQALHS